MLSAKEVALAVTKALDEKKGIDIKLLKIDKVSSLADYFLICTGTVNTHVKTLCDYAEYTMEQLGETMLGQRVLGIVAEGLDVGIDGTGADQEVISQRADLVDLQQLDAHALLLVQSLGGLISDSLCR